jgi:phenylacetate-CoA ligase
LNSFYLTRDSMPDYLLQINRYRPEVIVAYVAPLYELAQFIKDKSLPRRSPETIVTGAELLHPHQRTLIEEDFGCPVHSTYGCREFMLIAAECSKRGGMHINTDHLVVEVLDDRGVPASSGEVVITDLHNYAMPFIRYINGDLATLSAEHCPCGRGLPLMQSVDGRKLDTIRTRAGHAVPGAFFPHMFKEVPTVARFQVVQNSLEDLDIVIVKLPEFNDADLTFIQREVTKILGEEIHIKYRFVDDIPLPRSGKQRVTVSHLEA